MVGVEGLDGAAVGVMGVAAGDCTVERGGKTERKKKPFYKNKNDL